MPTLTPPPRGASVNHDTAFPRNRLSPCGLNRDTMDVGLRPVRSFVLPFRSVPPEQGTGFDCLAEDTAQPFRIQRRKPAGFLLERRSQSTAFESPGCHTRHRGTTPAAILLPGLVMVYVSPNHDSNVECGFGQSVTSLESVTSRLSSGTARAPARAQFPHPVPTQPAASGREQGRGAISAGRTQKRPLIRQNEFSPFGYVSD